MQQIQQLDTDENIFALLAKRYSYAYRCSFYPNFNHELSQIAYDLDDKFQIMTTSMSSLRPQAHKTLGTFSYRHNPFLLWLFQYIKRDRFNL